MKKQKRKIDEKIFQKKKTNNRNSENKFLEGLTKCFSAKRKKSIYLVRKNTIEKKQKQKEKRGETTKEIKQKQFYKKGMNN